MLCMNGLQRMAQGPEGPKGEGWGRGVRKGVGDGGGGEIDLGSPENTVVSPII